MRINIKNWLTGETIASGEAESLAAFVQAKVEEQVSLSRANLSYANLRYADLSYANLRGANLRDVVFEDVPIVEKLHIRMLEAIEAGGVLEMDQWHFCETTHCRAGWAIHLAGPAGYHLEYKVGPSLAGALISLRSCTFLERVPNFYANNVDALADIRACAEKEQ